jgi:hypothetical protein
VRFSIFRYHMSVDGVCLRSLPRNFA